MEGTDDGDAVGLRVGFNDTEGALVGESVGTADVLGTLLGYGVWKVGATVTVGSRLGCSDGP
jgi:hypothetical protein